jgi:hypothetical protein
MLGLQCDRPSVCHSFLATRDTGRENNSHKELATALNAPDASLPVQAPAPNYLGSHNQPLVLPSEAFAISSSTSAWHG